MIEYEDIILNNSQFLSLCRGDLNCNSFLFESSDEVFLSNFSYCFAKFLLCSSKTRPCNVCDNCKKVSLMSHSDVTIYPKNKKNILVDDIKDLIENVYLSPIESDKKVFIFNNFSSANTQSQNKLLKILEEPPKNAYILLNVTNANKVLLTVLSRCKKIRLLPLEDDQIKRVLNNVEKDKLEEVLDISQGSLSKAIKYSCDNNFSVVYENCLKTLLEMKDSRVLLKYSSMLSSEKNNINIVLEVFESFYRDLLLIKLNKNGLIKNKNLLNKFVTISSEYDCNSIDKIIRKIYEIKESCDFNCNEVLLIDNLLLYILEVKFLCNKK